jgi:uncharacterized protein (TIGR02246 family)
MIRLRLLAIVLASAAVQGCSGSKVVIPADEEAAVRRTDAAWLAVAAAHDVNRTLPFWADDATIMVPGAPPVVGKEAIRKYVADSFSIPGFSISWKTEKVEVSQSGDLAFSTGTNVVSFNGPDGKVVTQNGNSAAVWKKEPDGSWKCILDVMTPAPDLSTK